MTNVEPITDEMLVLFLHCRTNSTKDNFCLSTGYEHFIFTPVLSKQRLR